MDISSNSRNENIFCDFQRSLVAFLVRVDFISLATIYLLFLDKKEINGGLRKRKQDSNRRHDRKPDEVNSRAAANSLEERQL